MTHPCRSTRSRTAANAAISEPLEATSTCARTVPVAWSSTPTRCTRDPSGRRAPRADLPSKARARRPAGVLVRVASHAPSTPSRTSGSTPARVRANVDSRGGRRRTPTRWPSPDGRSPAQAAIAATEQQPASTAAAANVRIVANACRTPRGSRGSGTVESTHQSSTTSSSPSGAWPSRQGMNEDVHAGMTTSRTRERLQHPSRSTRSSCPPGFYTTPGVSPRRHAPARL